MGYILYKILKKMRGSAVKNSEIHGTSKIESGSVLWGTKVGKHSFCGYDCEIINCDIGNFCSIASNVSIGGVAHPVSFVSTSPVFLSHKDSVSTKYARHNYLPQLRTQIGHDVWIGKGAYLKAGVTIGNGAVVGMGAVVTKDVEPYAIVAGNPAKLIRKRFSDDMVIAMLETKWWEFSDEDLKKFGPYFDDPEAFLKALGFSRTNS